MSDKTNIGDRQKFYEQAYSFNAIPMLPLMARLDGRSFSRFTKGLNRPFDEGMSQLMIHTCKFLVKESEAICGYTQSDEITLCFYTGNFYSQLFFDGKIQKINSVLAAMASAYFNKNLKQYLPQKSDQMPVFDCRTWNVPNLEEAANVFVWREIDATKNAISMAAREYYSHEELNKVNSKQKQELLFAKGINFNDYPDYFKRGTYCRKKLENKQLTFEDIELLPLKHNARTNPNFTKEFTVISVENPPPILRLANKLGYLFSQEEPILVGNLDESDND